MKKSIGFLFLTYIGFGLLDVAPASTLDENLKSLAASYNKIDLKLSNREEVINSLDKRVRNIEARLVDQEKKYIEQTNEHFKSLVASYNNIDQKLWNREKIINSLYERVSHIAMDQEKKYNKQTEKIDEVMKLIKQLEEDGRKNVAFESSMNVELLTELHALSGTIAELFEVSTKMLQKTDFISERAPRTEELITRMEKRMVGLHVPSSAPVKVDNSRFENKLMESIRTVAKNVEELKAVTPSRPPAPGGLKQADRDFIQGLIHENLKAVENFKNEALFASENGCRDIEGNANLKETMETLRTLNSQMNVTYTTLNDSLTTFKEIILSNSDAILKAPCTTESGTLRQISQKEEQPLELSQAIMKHLHDMAETILKNHGEVLETITTTMQSEIRYVWQELNFMRGAVTETKNKVNRLAGQTEFCVNGIISTTDCLDDEVEQLVKNLLDFDTDLKSLVRRLSLSKQESDYLRTRVEQAMENIRDSLRDEVI